MINAQYKEFIGIYKNTFEEGFCEHLIKDFDRLLNYGAGGCRQISENEHKHNKEDKFILYSSLNLSGFETNMFNEKNPVQVYFDGLQQCFDDYTSTFSILKQSHLKAIYVKLQKTPPGGGYHVWHCEKESCADHVNRVLVFSTYLNDIDEGGETEFLYQKIRIKPEKNTTIIFPADFTHVHRGNTNLSEKDKYLATGWFNFN